MSSSSNGDETSNNNMAVEAQAQAQEEDTVAGLKKQLRLANVKNATMAYRIRVLERKMGISLENKQRVLDVNMLMLGGGNN